MRRIFIPILTVIFLTVSACCFGMAKKIEPPVAPAKATTPSPVNAATGQDRNVDLSWVDGGGAYSYDIYFGTDPTPDSGEYIKNTPFPDHDPGELAYNTVYYWRIDSINPGGTTTGDVWHFTTETEPEELPSKAVNPTPGNGTIDNLISTDISWSNGGGATSYDVYFGTDSTPDEGELIGNQTTLSYNPGTLLYETEYFWRIDAVNSSGTTTGDIWSFTTKAESIPGGTLLSDYVDQPALRTIKVSVGTLLPYHVYAGISANKYLWREYRDILYLVLKSVYITHHGSGVECEFTGVYDACGTGEGHPSGSHKFGTNNGWTIDLSYWTLIGDCFTQQWNIPAGYSYNPLWDSGLIDTWFVARFDWQRFRTFALRIRHVFPNVQISVDQRIKDYVLQRVDYVYGTAEKNKLTWVTGDSSGLYDHDKHMHVVLDTYMSSINWSADLADWGL